MSSRCFTWLDWLWCHSGIETVESLFSNFSCSACFLSSSGWESNGSWAGDSSPGFRSACPLELVSAFLSANSRTVRTQRHIEQVVDGFDWHPLGAVWSIPLCAP